VPEHAGDDLETLMGAANRGDAAAYRKLLEALLPLLRRTVRVGLLRNGGDASDVEDVVQETLLAIHLKRHTWDERLPLVPWVRAVAYHKVIDSLWRRGSAKHVPIDDYMQILDGSGEVQEQDGSVSMELLAFLKPRSRQIVEAITIEGLSAREAGTRLGMSEGAVRVTLHRALKDLARTVNRGPQ
jgi:RNA polymerase sigma-70 factor, ECF subfamily